jgi:hypothetical protein
LLFALVPPKLVGELGGGKIPGGKGMPEKKSKQMLASGEGQG